MTKLATSKIAAASIATTTASGDRRGPRQHHTRSTSGAITGPREMTARQKATPPEVETPADADLRMEDFVEVIRDGQGHGEQETHRLKQKRDSKGFSSGHF